MTSLVSLFSRPSPLRFGKESFKTRNATVHTAYDPGHPPPHPGSLWTRFVCLSDTHSETFQVPPGDVLLHSGDLSKLGTYDQSKITIDWLRSLPHPVKIIIAGNHDLPLHESWYEAQYHVFHRTKEVGSMPKRVKPSVFVCNHQADTFAYKEVSRQRKQWHSIPPGSAIHVPGQRWWKRVVCLRVPVATVVPWMGI